MHTRRWRNAPARHSAQVTLLLRHCAQDLNVRTPKRELGCEQMHVVESIAGRWRRRQRPSSAPFTEPHRAFKHNLQLLVGSPCQHSCSTNPSLAHSIRPSSWRSLRCNRRGQERRRQERNRRPVLGSPFRAPCSTTLSCPQTIPPPNWRSRRRNCMGRQEELA